MVRKYLKQILIWIKDVNQAFIYISDPLSMSPQKALEAIGINLQKQYERWQPRARYKQTLDPTADEVSFSYIFSSYQTAKIDHSWLKIQ